MTDGTPAGPVQPGWEYGVPVSFVRDLVTRWRDEYDWRAREAEINAFPQFTTEIDGQSIHFLHVRSPEPDATPLILTHGWPNTFVEYLDLIGPLTDPRAHGGDPSDAFHVVIPSLPGFGFSGHTKQKGWGAARTADAWHELMRRLGYDRYAPTATTRARSSAPSWAAATWTPSSASTSTRSSRSRPATPLSYLCEYVAARM